MHSRFTLWQLVFFILAFFSCIQSLDAAAIRARPRRPVHAKKAAKAPGRTSPPRVGGLRAPGPTVRPEVFLAGQFVGVRVKTYEPGSRIDTIHPGIVVAGPFGDRQYRVSMISSRLPGNPPQKPVSTYKPGMEGNISLSPVTVPWSGMKIWKQKNSGSDAPATALDAAMLRKLLADIAQASGQ